MKPLRDFFNRKLRGPVPTRMLVRFGIHPKRFWILFDLFSALSESGESTAELGRNVASLKTGAVLFAVISAVLTAGMLIAGSGTASFLAIFLGLTGICLLPALLSETGNTLVNPVEGMVLAHQPVNGATYTAAKLSHLFSIVLYFVTAIDAIPAVAGVFLPRAPWYYPLLHLTLALLFGMLLALACCGLFGWLLRIFPAKRLKMAVQVVSTAPFLLFAFGGRAMRTLNLARFLPDAPAARNAIVAALVLLFTFLVWTGLRSLSADYLVRASALSRGGPVTASRRRAGWMSRLVSRFFGGQTARGGFVFVSRMMLRDWQFLRQIMGVIFMPLLRVGSALRSGWRIDPFSGTFAAIQLLPHVTGALLFFICVALPYGNDYKGAWIFSLAPSGSAEGFARGVHAALWIPLVAIPHLALLPLFAGTWGIYHALLFFAFSTAAASTWLGIELKLIHGTPFCKQVQATGSTFLLPTMLAGGFVSALAAALQHFILFRSPALVIAATLLLAATAFFTTRHSLSSLAVDMRYDIAVKSAEVDTVYKEILT